MHNCTVYTSISFEYVFVLYVNVYTVIISVMNITQRTWRALPCMIKLKRVLSGTCMCVLNSMYIKAFKIRVERNKEWTIFTCMYSMYTQSYLICLMYCFYFSLFCTAYMYITKSTNDIIHIVMCVHSFTPTQ